MGDKILGFIKLAIFLLIIALLGYMGWQYLSLEIKNYQLVEEINKILYGEIRSDEYLVKDKVMEKLSNKGINLTYDDVNITKNGYNSCHVDFTYVDSITIPLINKSFYFTKEVNTTVTPQ
uniref:DUF4845 domain-containing protein n=1 Tax=candidate division WOR-3 bacterium TaxID=2052148 RepID=A0A7C3J5H2_UNCW3